MAEHSDILKHSNIGDRTILWMRLRHRGACALSRGPSGPVTYPFLHSHPFPWHRTRAVAGVFAP